MLPTSGDGRDAGDPLHAAGVRSRPSLPRRPASCLEGSTAPHWRHTAAAAAPTRHHITSHPTTLFLHETHYSRSKDSHTQQGQWVPPAAYPSPEWQSVRSD